VQGDIVAVYNSSGTKLISYTYTAWGECIPQTFNGGHSTAAANNPMRYRGYYYDTDLSLYYLISRYYDARVGRFISPDIYVSTGQGIIGNNMFAYCDNNPIMLVDPTGDFPWIIAGVLIVTTVVGAILGATSDVKLGEIQNEGEFSDPEQSITETPPELTTGDRIKNAIIGAFVGLAVGGALIATGGAFLSLTYGATATIGLFGATGVQIFAMGALALDFSAFFVMPIFGIEMQGIEYETPQPIPIS